MNPKSRRSILWQRLLATPGRSIFLFALLIRIPLWLYVSIWRDGSIFSDDRTYLNLIRDYAAGDTSGWDDYRTQLWSKSLSFLGPTGLLSKLVGFHPPLILLLSVIVGSAVIGLTTVLLSVHVKRETALCFGAVFALMPSQVLWSSLLLKDGYIALGFICIAFLLRKWYQSSEIRTFVVGSGALAVALLYVQRIRVHSLVVVCFALVLTVLFTRTSKKFLRFTVVVGLMVIMPWMISGGIAGTSFIKTLASGMTDQRVAGAIDASTAVVPTDIPIADVPISGLPVEDLPIEDLPIAPQESSQTFEKIVEEIRYLPSGLKVMLLDPLPSQLAQSRSMFFAFAEHIIWYPLLLLAGYGMLKRRRWTVDLVFASLLFVGLTTMWALAEGNFGTAFRHRTEFVWVIYLFAAVGADTLRVNYLSKKPRNEQKLSSG